jgi:CheY-like chemotaxis protein
VLLVSILPIGLFAAGLLYLHFQAQERERERSQVQLARLLAASVDNALDGTVERLSILARLWESRALSDEQIHATRSRRCRPTPTGPMSSASVPMDAGCSARTRPSRWGWRPLSSSVLPAADGPAALDLLQRERASVGILDIGLPGMDGYQLARRLREAFGRQIVLIALTGYGLETDAEKAMQAGFDLHLTKPVDLQKLAQAIEIAGRSRQAVASD